jgi:hypothetical protein
MDRASLGGRQLVAAVRERRNTLRRGRTESADAHREVSAARTSLSRKAVDLAGELATARAEAERLARKWRGSRPLRRRCGEIEVEWDATLEAARHEAEKHPSTPTKNATTSPAN